MILDGYAAYLLAKKRAEETLVRWEVWSSPEGFFIGSVDTRDVPCGSMHIIIVNPHTKVMTREEYMRWL
jgi:hypothetical protein